MKIIDMETKLYRIPPSVPWEDSTHSVSGLEFVVTWVTTDTGIVGTGISYTVGVGGTSIKALIDDYMANMILGNDPGNIEEIWNLLYGQLHRCGEGGITTLAIAAIDIALWDIRGKLYNQPLYKLLGGARDKILAYASGIDFHLNINELEELVDDYVKQGYQAVKIKIGKDEVAEDIERVAKVRQIIGPARRLLVDVNQKWNAHQARQACAALEPFQLGWIEEPIISTDIEGHAQLKKRINTPIGIGESLYNKYQFLEYLQRGAVDIVQADVARVGGITEWIKISHLADTWHKPVAPHFLMEISAHLLCGVPNGLILENVKGGSLTELGVLEHPIVVSNGYCIPPSTPGHGIILNRDELEKYKVDPQQLRSLNLSSKK